MNYCKGLQSLMMAALLVSTVVLSASAQQPEANPAWRQWETLQKQFSKCVQARDYACAERFARQALALAERAFGPERLETAISLNNLALVAG